tara:strand:- start:170 stop:487 length:318 start_codon:yes stop_codon:yes gene_type:complete
VKIINYDSYILVNTDKNSSWELLLDFLNKNNGTTPNCIINILETNLDTDVIIRKLIPFYLNWEKQNKSFILVSHNGRNIAKDIVLIKTLEEAVDFFHMQQLIRNI